LPHCYQVTGAGTILEEEDHLKNCRVRSNYDVSKVLGERLLLTLEHDSGGIAIFRPGLIVGKWAYHLEWSILYRSLLMGIKLPNWPPLPITPAKDIAKAAIHLLGKGGRGLQDDWYIVAPYTITLGELQRHLRETLTNEEFKIDLKNIEFIIKRIAYITKRFWGDNRLFWMRDPIYIPRKLEGRGFKSWTPVKKAIDAAAKWLSDYHYKKNGKGEV
jgi:nucleoside-diphosphate-sugar epimerase